MIKEKRVNYCLIAICALCLCLWGGIYDFGKFYISLSKHKTTDNLELKKAFTVGFATKKNKRT